MDDKMIELDSLHKIVIEAVQKAVHDNDDDIGLEDDFKDFGIDSLDAMSVTLEIEKALKIEFPEDFDLTSCNNVVGLHKHLNDNFEL
jgi:acyl carrier protein